MARARSRRDARKAAAALRDGSGLASVDTVRLYLHEIGRVDLLRADEEVDLAKRIAAGRAAAELLHEPGRRWSEQDTARLRRLVRDGDRARACMTEANLRLVVSLAKRHLGRGLGMSDLIQEGNLGLMRAVERFDASKGYRFSTYATWWIRQTLGRAVADQSRTIRIPAHHQERIRKLRRVERELEQQLQRPATEEELAVALELEVTQVRELRQWMSSLQSLDLQIGADGDTALGDLLEDESVVPPHLSATLAGLQHDLMQLFEEHLNERERRILMSRFGLGGGTPKTLDQLGDDLGLTRERVRQIEARALARLRHPAFAEVLESYLRD